MCFNPKETPEVTCLEWSPVYQDLIAVGIGSFDVLNANTPGGRGGRNQKLFPPTSRFTGSLFSEELQLAGNEPQIANRVSLLQKRSGHVKFGAIQSQVVSFRLVVNIYRDISLLAKSNQSLIIKSTTWPQLWLNHMTSPSLCLSFHPLHPHLLAVRLKHWKSSYFLSSNPNPRSGFPAEPSSFSTCRKTGLVSLSTLDLNEWT